MSNFYMIGHLEIPNRLIMSKPLYYFETNNKEGVNKLFKELKKMTGYQYDNSHLKWSNSFGHLFALSIYLSAMSVWNIRVWDTKGTTTVITLRQEVKNVEEDTLSKKNYKRVCEVTKKFNKGIVLCSNCSTEMNKENIAGRYFAGIYCEECWESKYKEIEAKETYN